MEESRKIAVILSKEPLDAQSANMNKFVQDFSSYLRDMNMIEEKKQLVKYPNDFLPCLVRFNGF